MAVTSSCSRIAITIVGFGLLYSISLYKSYLKPDITSARSSNQLPGNIDQIGTLFSVQSDSFSNISQTNAVNDDMEPLQSVNTKRQVWVSMGLCFSKNLDALGKSKYPYALSAPLAMILWYHFIPSIKVIIYIVYDNSEHDDQRAINKRKRYEDQLKQINVEVRWVMSQDMSCVTKSQIIRMWAFQDPMINDNDVVVTADVDLYVLTPKILDPIDNHPELKVWLFQYDYTAFYSSDSQNPLGKTFNQNLISATSKAWREIIEPREDVQLNQNWLTERVEEIAAGEEASLGLSRQLVSWTYDQWVCTYGILKSKLCTVPKTSGLWKTPGLVTQKLYFPDMDDSNTCWHGENYRDCNKGHEHRKGGCKWWHFFPRQRYREMVKKFNQITDHQYNITFV